MKKEKFKILLIIILSVICTIWAMHTWKWHSNQSTTSTEYPDIFSVNIEWLTWKTIVDITDLIWPPVDKIEMESWKKKLWVYPSKQKDSTWLFILFEENVVIRIYRDEYLGYLSSNLLHR